MVDEIRVTAARESYDLIMDSIVGALVICGYHIHVTERGETDASGKYLQAFIAIEDGGRQKSGKCGNVEVVRI